MVRPGIVTIISLLWTCISLGSALPVIEGVVRDISNLHLGDVVIICLETDQTVISGADGQFSIELREEIETVTLLIEHPQYRSERKNIRLLPGKNVVEVVLIPLNVLNDEVTITALNVEEKSADVPFAQTVVSSMSIKEEQPENIVSSLQRIPGVHFIGKGGYTATPSIRGLARRRILVMANGNRITSDRSVGSSAGFIPPEFVRRMEVLRSSASVIYGSDAIGGVLNILTEDRMEPQPRIGMVNFGFNSNGWRRQGGFRFSRQMGDYNIYGNIQAFKSDDYSSAEERVFNSGYAYYAGNFVLSHSTDERDISFAYLKSYGKNIYRPRRDNNPDRKDLYPEEDNNLFQFNLSEKTLIDEGSLNIAAFFNPNSSQLEKYRLSAGTMDYSHSDAWDVGVRASVNKSVRTDLSVQFGFDYYGRHSVDIRNGTETAGQLTESSMPLSDGNRHDYGLYFTVDYSGISSVDLLGGLRYGYFTRNARVEGIRNSNSDSAPAAFFGITRRLGDHVSIFCNLGTAFRMPALSEAYYTGITGRGGTVGNPDLTAERSYNLDGGVKFYNERFFVGCYLFQYQIRDLIEKYEVEDELYTYDNLDRGRIRGVELEMHYRPVDWFECFGNYYYYIGRNTSTEGYLNDIPSPKIFLGAKYWRGRFWTEINHAWSSEQNRPGPAEIMNPSYNLTNLKAGYYLSSRLFFFARIANLFNTFYYANADPDIPAARGFDFSCGLNYQF